MEEKIVKTTKFFLDLTSKTPDLETFQINLKPKGKDFAIVKQDLTLDHVYNEYLKLLKEEESSGE